MEPKKPVITISKEELPFVVEELLNRMAAGNFVPDAYLGIASGGVFVVDALPAAPGVARFTCTMRRQSTAMKKRNAVTRGLMRKLPLRVTDVLRLLEGRVREFNAKSVPPPSPSLMRSLDSVGKAVREQGIRNIAVFDDAVDTGATLACVTSALKERVPADVSVRTAVITCTRGPQNAFIRPDFVVYENVNCRFPWSMDYQESL